MPGYPPRRSLGALENINDWMAQGRADLRHLEQDARVRFLICSGLRRILAMMAGEAEQ
jgi:hypothetical protein